MNSCILAWKVVLVSWNIRNCMIAVFSLFFVCVRRCCYECTIVEGDEGAPEFVITVKEHGHNNTVYKGTSPKEVWSYVLDIVDHQRKQGDCVKIFPEFLSGEYMFGLKESAIIRIIESVSHG